MAVRMRLTRVGSKKNPVYRVVVADSRSPRDGRFVEQIGTYDPNMAPAKVTLKREQAERWLKAGARPSETVSKLIKKATSAAQTA